MKGREEICLYKTIRSHCGFERQRLSHPILAANDNLFITMSSSDAMQCSPEVDSNAESVVAKALTSVDKDIDDIETVAENSRVLLMTRDQSFTLHRARRGSDVRVGRVRVLCDPIIGVPYGSVFRVVMGELKRVHTSYLDEDTQHKGLNTRSVL